MGLHLDFFAWAARVPWVVVGLFALAMVSVVGLLVGRRRALRSADPSAVPAAPEPAAPAQAEAPGYDPFLLGSVTNKRQTYRRRGSEVAVHVSDADAKAASVPGTVVDRSMTGVRLAVDAPAAAGTILSIRPAREAALIPWVQVEVKGCYKADTGWELGCQFVKVPPTTVLWSFG